MTDITKQLAETLAIAEALESRLDCSALVLKADVERAAAELRRLAAVEAERNDYLQRLNNLHINAAECRAERDRLRARLDRAINAAVEHFGEDAIRYKFSLTKSGKVMQEFPRHMDGHWYALQRADDDAHVGLSLRCAEAEAERDRLAAEVEALRADAERYRWLRNEAWGGNNKRGPHLVEFKPGYVPARFTDLAEDAADAAIDSARKEQG